MATSRDKADDDSRPNCSPGPPSGRTESCQSSFAHPPRLSGAIVEESPATPDAFEMIPAELAGPGTEIAPTQPTRSARRPTLPRSHRIIDLGYRRNSTMTERTVKLGDEQVQALERLAAEDDQSVDVLVRQAVDAYLAQR